MRVLAIFVILCPLISIGCTSEKPNETSNYDAGIEAYKRGHYAVALSNFESRVMKDENDFIAQFCLGYMYDLRQVPLPQNLKNSKEAEKKEKIEKWYKENAEKCYIKAAEQDYVPAQNNLAVMYFLQSEETRIKMKEVGLTPDLINDSLANLSDAVQWLKNPEAQTHYISQYNIAFMHYNHARLIGKHQPAKKSDKAEAYKDAVYWFTKAAEQEYDRAQNELADSYYYGEGVDENLTEVERWEEAVKWYTKAANNGNAYAQYRLALMYQNGKGVEANLTEVERWEEAVKWYTKAANNGKNGNAYAQYYLARMYQNGKGVDENLTEVERWEEAVKWYTKAAEQNYAPAQNNLALMYQNGQGVNKNLEKATRLYFQAAQQGHIVAQVNVGKSFEEGVNGVPQDNAEAYYWYSLALKYPTELDKQVVAENIAAKVDKWRKSVGSKIEEKKNGIQKRVDEWKPKILSGSGTGFYIDKNHILTNAHVIYQDRDGNKRKYDELRVNFRYVIEKQGAEAVDHDVDLALLFDESERMYTATFRNDPVYRGEKIALFGYPLSLSWLSYEGNATSGDVSGLLGTIKSNLSENLQDPLNLFQHTAPQQPGNSGGPVFDSDGNVVGISVSGLDGYRIENVNFAIKFEATQKFLNDNNIDVNSVSKDIENMDKVIDLNKISTKAERFTKHVLCFKNITPKPSMLTRMSIGYWKF